MNLQLHMSKSGIWIYVVILLNACELYCYIAQRCIYTLFVIFLCCNAILLITVDVVIAIMNFEMKYDHTVVKISVFACQIIQ
jgi:hypothetical protein